MSRNTDTTQKRKASGGNQSAFQSKHPIHNGNSAHIQQLRVLAALRKRPMTTLEIRRELDVLGVAPRVLELRRKGNKIETHWLEQATECGKLHRVALYVLIREAR